MATVSPTRLDNNSRLIQWADLATGDTINQASLPLYGATVASVQAAGTFGGATVALHGSNDGTNFVALNDVDGNAISFTAAGMVEFSTACLYLKPVISGGSSDAVDVTVSLRG